MHSKSALLLLLDAAWSSERACSGQGVKADGNGVIRENAASRGTEASAEVLVGPPGRMVSRTPVNK